jgi:dolichol-phosphate mannosyltransferase
MSPSRKVKCCIILPTYNEGGNVITLIDQILALGLDEVFQILVVDDDSQDLTWKAVETRYAEQSNVQVLRRVETKRGLVASLNDAISITKADYILWMDADLQMPANKIPDFFKMMKEVQPTAVIGSRFISGGSDVRHQGDVSHGKVTIIHRCLSNWLSLVVPRLLDLPVTDVTSGFIMVSRDFFNEYLLEGDHGEYFINLVYELHRTGHRIVEIPYILSARTNGVSKSTQGKLPTMIKVGLRYLKVTLRLLNHRIWKKSKV